MQVHVRAAKGSQVLCSDNFVQYDGVAGDEQTPACSSTGRPGPRRREGGERLAGRVDP
jgi:hypothetical protein